MMMSALRLAIFFYLFTTSFILNAQSLFVGEGQILWINTGGLVTVNGNTDNLGEMTNQGELSASGNWAMQGTYFSENGAVIFNGNETQQIDHNNQKFDQLTIANGGEKVILSDLIIGSVLILESGIIRAESNQQVVFEPQVEVIGGNNMSFVDGIVVNKGTSYKIFPLGNEAGYFPLELLEVQGNNPVLSATLMSPHPQTQQLDGLETVSSQRYWQLASLSGTYEGSAVSIRLADEPEFDDLTGLVVAAAPDLSSTYVSLGNGGIIGTLTEGTISSEVKSNLSIISLGLSSQYSAEGNILVPNAFAPDSPLEKDRTLTIFAANLATEDFVFRVFNRWGKLVYQTTSVEEARQTGWNGINQETNQVAQFGVYSYYLSGQFSNNVPFVKKGTVTLFR